MILSTSLELRLLTNILSAPLSYVLPAGIKGLTAVTLQTYNSCGEKTELDVGISTGQVASHSLSIISKGLLRFG